MEFVILLVLPVQRLVLVLLRREKAGINTVLNDFWDLIPTVKFRFFSYNPNN